MSFFLPSKELVAFGYLPASWCGLSLALLLGWATPAQAQTQTPFSYNSGQSYLFQGAPTIGYLLDFASGATTQQGTGNGYVYNTSTLNAFGYNPVDNYMWGQINGQSQLVRVGSEFQGKAYSFTQPTGFSQTTFTVADVDINGQMYMTRGGSAEGKNNSNTDVYIIDLKQTTTPFTATVLSFPVSTFLTDWAMSPKDTCLYAINAYFPNGDGGTTNQATTTLYRFVTHDRTFNGHRTSAGTRETIGTATGGSTPIAPANFAAAFMDNSGSFYVVASNTGLVHRIDRPNLQAAVPDANAAATSIPATYVGTVTSGNAGNVDGARYAFSKPSSGALPVTLVSFVATAAPNRAVRLDWHTASELNNDSFEVQHSLDGGNFAAIGRVAGHSKSIQPSVYSFTDAAPGAAATHYYRLRQVDMDGTSTFSPVQAVTLAATTSPLHLSVAPNPTSSASLQAQVHYEGVVPVPAILTVQDMLGRCLLTQAITLQPGTNTLAPTNTLVPGVYWLSVASAVTTTPPGVRVLLIN